VLKRNFIETATKIMLDVPVDKPDSSTFDIDSVGVKASQFSFSRLHKADPILGVDMSSTGEVGWLGADFDEAMMNAMLSVGYHIPQKGVLVSSGDAKGKVDLLDTCKMLQELGYRLYATEGTQKFLAHHQIEAVTVSWPDEDESIHKDIMKLIANHEVDLVINIPKDYTKRELTNGYKIRRSAIDHNIPLLTNARLASAFIRTFCHLSMGDIQIKSWGEY
jgi:carbamoyl-phosphate synthase large subunit